MATSLDLARTYTSYSGVDIRVVINGAQVGSMQALSYAIQREKAPIYVMGSVDPISYSRGKRGIAGTMISLMMDTHILHSASFTGEYYLGDTDELVVRKAPVAAPLLDSLAGPNYNNLNNEVNSPLQLATLGNQQFGSSQTVVAPGQTSASIGGPATQRLTRETSYELTDIGQNYRVAPVYYVDQILPFDIAIVAANEYGQSAQMRLYGCEILNEGSGFSIDDIVIENQMTYVCRTILPWRSFDIKAIGPDGGKSTVNARDALYTREGTINNRGAQTPTSGSSAVQYTTTTAGSYTTS